MNLKTLSLLCASSVNGASCCAGRACPSKMHFCSPEGPDHSEPSEFEWTFFHLTINVLWKLRMMRVEGEQEPQQNNSLFQDCGLQLYQLSFQFFSLFPFLEIFSFWQLSHSVRSHCAESSSPSPAPQQRTQLPKPVTFRTVERLEKWIFFSLGTLRTIGAQIFNFFYFSSLLTCGGLAVFAICIFLGSVLLL